MFVFAGSKCYSPYVQLGDMCFYIEDKPQTHDEARTTCGELAGDSFAGGDLISPSDCDSFVLLSRYLELNGNYYKK